MYKCKPCRKQFSNKVLLQNHLARSHKNILSSLVPGNDSDSSSDHGNTHAIEAPLLEPEVQSNTNAGDRVHARHSSQGPLGSLHLSSSPAENDQLVLASIETRDESKAQGATKFPSFDIHKVPADTGDVSIECWLFFKALKDRSEPVYSSIDLNPGLESLHPSCKKVIEHCMERCLTIGDAKTIFDLVTYIEEEVGPQYRHVSSQFGTAEKFATYLMKVRKYVVVAHGWKTSVIQSEIGLNKTGAFRPVLRLLRQELARAGGPDAVIPFQAEYEKGERVYSDPHNSNALEEYHKAMKGEGKVVLIDVYSDATTLSSSGTQTANTFRVRFSNIRGATKVWHEVGLVPIIPRDATHTASQARLRRIKNELWHRFVFLALEDVMKHSHSGFQMDGTRLYPRIGLIVADQVQERPSCGLKGHGGYHDCTHCLIPTRRKPVFKDVTSVGNTHTHDEIESTSKKRKQNDFAAQQDSGVEGRHWQLEQLDVALLPRSSQRRNVYKTVKGQLELSKNRLIDEGHNKHSTLAEHERMSAKLYLSDTSALQFPSALSCFAGLGSTPYRLYSSVGFDMLHVIEHGILRQIADDAHKVFEMAAEYGGMSSSMVCAIANQRIMDLPASCNLRRFELFRKNANEKQAGVTGQMRREINPFLWYAVMGLSRNRNPDEDRFLQLLLRTDLLYRELVGINQEPKKRRRRERDIKNLGRLAFAVGHEMTLLLDANVNTKIHRTMFHIPNHLFDFGCIRKGSTDSNETLHKETKKSYKSTNKQMVRLAPQILNSRAMYPVPFLKDSHDDEDKEIETLVTRRRHVNASEEGQNSTYTTRFDQQISRIRSEVDDTFSPELVEKAVRNARFSVTEAPVWVQMSSVRFRSTFEWCDIGLWETVYSGQNVLGCGRRRDSVLYSQDSVKCFGIIQSVFALAQNKSEKVALVRRLRKVEGETGNVKVVTEFGNQRFMYHLAHGAMKTDIVPTRLFQRKVLLLPDPWQIVRLQGFRSRLNNLPDNPEFRRMASFFEIAGFKHTAFSEQ